MNIVKATNTSSTADWVCYILVSTDLSRTYVGATDNLLRRVNDHNGINGISRGAKATKGRQWYPVVVVSGFKSKIGCLSFETGIRRVKRRRQKKPYKYSEYNYTPIGRRIVDLYNLLYLGSPLKKWTYHGLCVNWLEKEYIPPTGFILPTETFEKKGLEVCL
jgi:predicted GIY-YIG superfamily endonuclease